jgi:hypothetical protein
VVRMRGDSMVAPSAKPRIPRTAGCGISKAAGVACAAVSTPRRTYSKPSLKERRARIQLNKRVPLQRTTQILSLRQSPGSPRPCQRRPPDQGSPLSLRGAPTPPKVVQRNPAPCRQLRNRPPGDRPRGLFYLARGLQSSASHIPNNVARKVRTQQALKT